MEGKRHQESVARQVDQRRSQCALPLSCSSRSLVLSLRGREDDGSNSSRGAADEVSLSLPTRLLTLCLSLSLSFSVTCMIGEGADHRLRLILPAAVVAGKRLTTAAGKPIPLIIFLLLP